MGIRVVAAALAVWCVSEAAMAAGYAEVWNPPEASRHVTKHAAKKPGVATKAESKHMASVRHGAPAVEAARGSKLAAHGGVKKFAGKGGATQSAKALGSGRLQGKATLMAQGGKPHAQLIRSKPGQGGVEHANLVVPRTARPQVAAVAAKPAAPTANTRAITANVSGGQARANTDPATASSGSLPPIIH
ncbi:hypothetical protein [Paraburkholderia sp. DGU8]|uniref:hypothetical protein n=1 Tax=Paraburkholderia sp. DGU8 TaxID=3161997 RepID=UPI0034671A9C